MHILSYLSSSNNNYWQWLLGVWHCHYFCAFFIPGFPQAGWGSYNNKTHILVRCSIAFNLLYFNVDLFDQPKHGKQSFSYTCHSTKKISSFHMREPSSLLGCAPIELSQTQWVQGDPAKLTTACSTLLSLWLSPSTGQPVKFWALVEKYTLYSALHSFKVPREHTAAYAPLFSTVCSLVRQ